MECQGTLAKLHCLQVQHGSLLLRAQLQALHWKLSHDRPGINEHYSYIDAS